MPLLDDMRGNGRLSNGPASSYVKSFTEVLHMRSHMVTKEGVPGTKKIY